tara:strand:+ start:6817 stop:7617 length:801 start_codon:yes stop_codon:yes gene_type:complete
MLKLNNCYLILFTFACIFIVLDDLNNFFIGNLLMVASLVLIYFSAKKDFKNYFLLAISFYMAHYAEINTNLDWANILILTSVFFLMVWVPAKFSSGLISFDFTFKKWSKDQFKWFLTTGFCALIILYFYFNDALTATGLPIHRSWSIEGGTGLPLDFINFEKSLVLFFACMLLGCWDEMFFVNTVLTIFKKSNPFWLANACQSLLFAAFLYELAFQDWGPWMIIFFAFIQGNILKKTHDLVYVICLHLFADTILFVYILNGHYSFL